MEYTKEELEEQVKELKEQLSQYESTVGVATSTSIIIDLNKLNDDETEKLVHKLRTTDDGVIAFQKFNYGLKIPQKGNHEKPTSNKTA